MAYATRLGQSVADLAGFVEEFRENDVDIDLVNQPIGTVDEDGWIAEMMLNMMMVFADAERKMIHSRVQEGIDAYRERLIEDAQNHLQATTDPSREARYRPTTDR